jgi:uncharacterized protein (DUF924 family)
MRTRALRSDRIATISAIYLANEVAAYDTTPDAILRFWFGEAEETERAEWFRKDAGFDSSLRARFGASIDAAIAGDFGAWTSPQHRLARILLLDQFTRNAYRGTSRAFAGDALALALASIAIDAGEDASLSPYQRWFLYIPFEHAESVPAQERAIVLYTGLAEQTGLDAPLPWVHRHADVIRRFGRFPHRNAVLGRASSAEEIEFLKQPGSSF